MLFEALENFEWYNEPENVRFEADSMVIYAKSGTEFWQSIHRNFKKDNGHFFFSRQSGDFILTLKWSFDKMTRLSQCGLMVRADERNWLKTSIMNEGETEEDVLSSAMCKDGHMDWTGFSLNERIHEIWFRIQRVDDDYVLFYSIDGSRFIRLRAFYMQSIDDIKVGAYVASPNESDFFAELSSIKFGV